MKKVTIALAMAVVGFAATSGLSRTISMRADVPIAFSLDGRLYAAGAYQLRTIADHAVRLSNAKTGDSAFVTFMRYDKGNGVNTKPNLKFIAKGRRAYLISFTDGDGNTWTVHVSRADLEACLGPGSKTVIVALK